MHRLAWASVRECHPKTHYSSAEMVRRPRLFAFTVSFATLLFVVVAYFAVLVFALGDIPFD